MLTNNFDINPKNVQGSLCTNIFDFYAIFHVARNVGITSADEKPVFKRYFSQNNIKFVNEMANVHREFIISTLGIHQNIALQRRYNGRNGVSNHQPHDCLLKRYNTGADQRKQQSSASLAFVRGIHRWPVDSPHKGPIMQETFPFDDVIMKKSCMLTDIRAIILIYRNKLHYLFRAAEHQHSQNLLYKHQSDVKNSWKILKKW